MSIAMIILGIVLLIPVAYVAVGYFCMSALGGSGWTEFILEWFWPVVIVAAIGACAIGGAWALLTGLAVI